MNQKNVSIIESDPSVAGAEVQRPFEAALQKRDAADKMTDDAATKAAKAAGFLVVDGKKLHGLGDVGKFMAQHDVVDIGRGMFALSATNLAGMSNNFGVLMEKVVEAMMEEMEDKGGLEPNSSNFMLMQQLTTIQQSILKQHADVATRLVKTAPEQVAPSVQIVPGPPKGASLTPAASPGAVAGARVDITVNGDSGKSVTVTNQRSTDY